MSVSEKKVEMLIKNVQNRKKVSSDAQEKISQ